MNKFLSILLVFWVYSVSAQLNMDSISHLNYNVLHGTELNDVWGYEDELGNEYALVGAVKGTSVVDISIPSSPVEIFWEPGMESIWRDLKTNGDYAYVTTEAENGLLIIDLSQFLWLNNIHIRVIKVFACHTPNKYVIGSPCR